MRILLDVDGILANCVESALSVLNRQTGRNHTSADISTFEFSCIASAAEETAMWAAFSETPGLVLGIPEYAWNVDAANKMRALGHQVCAVTTPRWDCPRWCYERAQWLRDRGFLHSEIVFTSDKSRIVGDVLVDDRFENVRDWQASHPHGRSILLDQPWNRAHTWHDRITTLHELL